WSRSAPRASRTSTRSRTCAGSPATSRRDELVVDESPPGCAIAAHGHEHGREDEGRENARPLSGPPVLEAHEERTGSGQEVAEGLHEAGQAGRHERIAAAGRDEGQRRGEA